MQVEGARALQPFYFGLSVACHDYNEYESEIAFMSLVSGLGVLFIGGVTSA